MFLRRSPVRWAFPIVLLTSFALIAEAADGGEPAKPALGLKRKEDELRLKRVFTFFDQQNYDGALTELKPVLEFQPELTTMQELACELWARKSAAAPETMAQCQKAGEMPGSGPISWLHLARAQLANGKGGEVLGSLGKARVAFDAFPKTAPFVWGVFADLCLEQRALTWADTAAEHLEPEDGAAVKAGVAKHRRWLGIPAGALSPEAEGPAAKKLAEAQKQINLDELKKAAELVAKLETELPKLAGTLSARCALDLANKKKEPAKKACAAALAAQPENVVALLNSSELAKPPEAIAALTKIVEVDPGHELAYRRLAELYRKRNDKPALQKLEERYQAQFKRPLPK